MHVYIEDNFIIQIVVLTDEAFTGETSEESNKQSYTLPEEVPFLV
jgi:hypothetical protein